MPNSPTIVSAALSDKELQDSINKMVANFDKGLQTMLEHSNEYVGKIQASLQKIGDTNFGAKGSNDGAVVKQTKAQKEATNETERRLKKEKEVNLTLDQRAEIMGRIPREMRMPDMAKSARESFQAFYKGFNEQARQLEPLIRSWERLLQSRHTGNIEQVAQQIRNVKSEIAAIIREQANLSRTKPQGYLEEIGKRNVQIKALRDQLVSLEAEQQRIKATDPFKGNPYLDTLRERLQAVKVAMNDIDTSNRQWLYRTNELAEAQKRLAVESMKSFYTHTMKMPTDQYDVQLAKLENIRALLQRIRSGEANFFTTTQVTGLEKEERRLVGLIGNINSAQQQVTSSTQQTTQAAQRYTEEIRKQAQAIRESQQWKEKGFVTVGNDVFYDPARSKSQTLSLEEQMLNAENRRIEAQEKLNAESQKEVEIKSQLPKQGYLFDGNTRDESSRQQQSRAALERYKQIQQEEQNVNSLNAAIMRSLHIGKDEVKNYDIRTASAKQLNAMLKQQRDAYANLTTSQRSQKGGVELAESIQRTVRALQKLQAAASRPISLQFAMGLSEKTLDEMAYKMRQLASYRSGLNIKTQANEIEQVNRKYAELQKSMNDIMRKNTEMIKSNTALGRSWNYMKNRLAFYFTVGASTQFIKNLIDVRSQYEMNERALGILINSAERGTQIFNELSQMALVSPYTLIELSTAAKQLTAYDIAAKDVVDTTRRLADMASAVGIPIERLTYALGQIKAYGYLNSRDARMFANAGIPLVKQLSDYYTQLEGRLVSTADVYDRIKKKTIDYEQVVQVINKMTDEGGKFFDFQAKMADTLKVRLANLTLAWNNMLNDIGSSNQGVLTTGIGLLRDMFLHWKDLESAISKVATAFGIYKTAQLVTLIWTGRITTAMGVQELVGKKLQARFASLTIAQKGFASAATAGWAALAFVVADAWLTISRNMEEIEQLNKSIADGAKESYEAIDKMLHSSEMVSTRLSAAQGKLSDTDAAKAWEMLREQIELSAASSKELIAQLLKEPDINKRVTESFNLAEKIEEANRKLSDLNDSLDVSQNSILGGLFGEGLTEDIDDYNARIKYTSDVAEWASKKNRGFWENAAMGLRALFNEVKDAFGSDANEAQDEIKNFAQKAAQTIKDELGEEGIKDKIQVNEAIARIVRGMEQQFPQIRGKGKVLFETIFYDTMANEFKGAVDSQAYYYEKFLEQLKKDHASAFSGVTEDINKETFKWSSAQIDAIQKTADKVKKDLPAASQGAIDEILRQLNSTDFKVRIVAEMATTSLDNVQKQFREKFIEKPWIADDKEREKAENEANQRYGTLMRKNTESNAEYEKRISDERKKQLELSQKNADIITKNKGKQEEFSKAVLADAQKQKEAADDWLKAAKDIEDKGGYDFSTKGENSAARKAAKQAESELAKALKDELSTIDKVRSIYKDLTKEGMSHANAVERATRGWDETVNAINRVLQKNGLQKLDLSKFAGIENPRELVNMLQSQLNTLLKRGVKPAEIKELQTKVNTLEVDADKYDLTKITKGLNNELGKLKDEYELAVELDANPELGGMFLDMFGIDPSDFSHNIDDYMFKVQSAFEKARRELGYGVTIDVFKANDEEWEKWGEWVGLNGEALDNFKAIFVSAQGVAKKWAQDTLKSTQDLQYKLADNNGKIAIEEEKLAVLRQRLAQETNDKQKSLLELQIRDQQNAIKKLKEEILQLLPTYNRLFGEVAEHSAAMTRKLARDYKNMLVDALKRGKNPDGTYTVIDPINGKRVSITEERLGKEIKNANKELGKTDNIFKKIKESLTKGEDGIVDWVGGIENIGEAIGQVGDLVDTIGNVYDMFGNPNEYDATSEALHDIATTMQGVNTAAKGIGQIASGDYIGGAMSVISGLSSAIGAWFDNGDKEILQEIKESELAVKRLELAYIDLEHSINNAYGMATIGAQKVAIANKELQLVELKRQLALEQSRDSKHRDEDRIVELQKQIKELEYDIKDATDAIVNDLLGISSVGDALENVMGNIIDAFRSGSYKLKDIMKDVKVSFNDMIANMVMKMYTTRVLQPWFEEQWNKIQDQINERAGEVPNKLAEQRAKVSNAKMVDVNNNDSLVGALRALGFSEEEIDRLNWYNEFGRMTSVGRNERLRAAYEKALKEAEQKEAEIQKELATATMPTTDDIRQYAELLRSGQPIVEENLKDIESFLRELGLLNDKKKSSLSALQQGLQSMSEDTGSALESYINGVSQQVYLHSDLLTQIRDAVVGMDMDIQLGVFSQMLLQLQNNYIVMQSMQSMMENWTVPSGSGIRVELMS